MAPAGGYTYAQQAGGEMNGGIIGTSSASHQQQEQQPGPPGPADAMAACPAPPEQAVPSLGGWSGATSFSGGRSNLTPQQLHMQMQMPMFFGGGGPPCAATAGGGTTTAPTQRSFSAPTSSFGSYGSGCGGTGRKRKCSGDGVETCGSCGHRLMAPRLASDDRAPEVPGHCNACVCRCALCGRPVLRASCAETILDEPLLLTARRLGIPLEDSSAMGQDIGLQCRVCADVCMKKLNRMRRMEKRRSSSGLLAPNNTAADCNNMDMS
jgi:hypothetical protein